VIVVRVSLGFYSSRIKKSRSFYGMYCSLNEYVPVPVPVPFPVYKGYVIGRERE
jgi:hypothetical protein